VYETFSSRCLWIYGVTWHQVTVLDRILPQMIISTLEYTLLDYQVDYEPTLVDHLTASSVHPGENILDSLNVAEY
jgi:hypothetical protein